MKFLSSLFPSRRPRPVRVLEQHGTRPAYRRDQPGANEWVSIGGITFRPTS
jgi:hypothetical protein